MGLLPSPKADALPGSSLVPAVLSHGSAILPAQSGDAAGGNVAMLRASAATGRYLQVDVTAPGMDVADIRRLVARPYGLQEGREVLDRRDRNALTGAEFPMPALANTRVVRFTLPLLSTPEARGKGRRLLRALGAAGEALWIPEVGLAQADMNARAICGAVAVPGEGRGHDAGQSRCMVPSYSGSRTALMSTNHAIRRLRTAATRA